MDPDVEIPIEWCQITFDDEKSTPIKQGSIPPKIRKAIVSARDFSKLFKFNARFPDVEEVLWIL